MGPTKIKNLKGEKGALYIADTAAHVGNWDTIVPLEAAVANIASDSITGDLSSIALPLGVPIYGRFTSITLASGKVIAYNAG